MTAVAILGGGTAGWMAACLMARAWPDASIKLIESPDIGIIGVGEGSTPQLRGFFAALGLAEADWMPCANATYKAGIAFHGWSGAPGFASYFHPFHTDLDAFTAPKFFANTMARRAGHDAWAHPDRFFLPAALGAARKSPLPAPNFPFDIGYGYHFDAHLIGAILREHATAVLGVEHVSGRVTSVQRAENGDVAALVLGGGEAITADIFIDCSGFRSVIAQEALGVRFCSYADNLFNDRAVVMPTPANTGGTNAHTKATALSAGWAWDIPLTNRTGNGYVYASRYTDADAAETELRRHLGLLDSDIAARHLTLKVGRVETSWTRNCVAIGLSQGFIEPLEATALHIVQATVDGFIRAWEAGGFTPAHRDDFNTGIADRYDGIRDYIVCHYRLNQRRDTAYWRDNAANQALSDTLKSIMTCWFTGGDLEAEIDAQGIGGYYSPLSWHCLLAGYGIFPDAGRVKVPPPLPVHAMAPIDAFIARCGLNFADHKTVLAGLNG